MVKSTLGSIKMGLSTTIGRGKMTPEQAQDNFCTLVNTSTLEIASAKGSYFKGFDYLRYLGPGVRVDPYDAQRVADKANP